jgi:hypothetical protein
MATEKILKEKIPVEHPEIFDRPFKRRLKVYFEV